jgi:hypothetical protein
MLCFTNVQKWPYELDTSNTMSLNFAEKKGVDFHCFGRLRKLTAYILAHNFHTT